MSLNQYLYIFVPILLQACHNDHKNYDAKKGDTPALHGHAYDNNTAVIKITFESSSCIGNCPSFQLQIDSSKHVLYNGLANVEKKGLYVGNARQTFWNDLLNRIGYMDINHLKKSYGSNRENEQTVALSIETNKGTYRCVVLDTAAASPALKDLISYIFSNYSRIETKPLDIDQMFKHDSDPRREAVRKFLEKIPC